MKPGKQALRPTHRAKVEWDVDCSVDLEEALVTESRDREKIFDYLVAHGRSCEAAFIEVHDADVHDIDDVIEKMKGTRQKLARAGSPVMTGTWNWVPTAGVGFTAKDKYGKRLAASGIKQPRAVLR